MTKLNNKILILPLIISLTISLGTVTFFYLSPHMWSHKSNGNLLIFLVSVNLSFIIGYMFRMLLLNNKKKITFSISQDYSRIHKFYKICSIVYIFTFIPDFLYSTRLINGSPSDLFKRYGYIFTQPEQNYLIELSYMSTGTALESIYVIFNVLISFFYYPIILLGIILWGRLNKIEKYILIVYIVMEINKWLLKGMNKGIFDLAILITISIFIKSSINGDLQRIFKFSIKKISNLIMLSILTATVISLFTFNYLSRTGGEISYFSPETNTYINPNNILLRIFPEFLHPSIIGLSTYLTQGYEGLGYIFDIKFTSTFPFGNSVFLMSNVESIFGVDIWTKTFMYKINLYFGWDEKVNWHSLYMWIANDVSIMGTPIIMFLIGYVFAHSWITFLSTKNPFSIIIFSLIFLMFFYVSANNQIMSYAYNFIPFWGSLLAWKFSSYLRFKNG